MLKEERDYLYPKTGLIEEVARIAMRVEVSLLLAELLAELPEREPVRRYLRPRCTAITAKGQQCAARAAPTGVLCRAHAAYAQRQKIRP